MPKALGVKIANPFAADPVATSSSTSQLSPQGPSAPGVASPQAPPVHFQPTAPPHPSFELHHPPPKPAAPAKNRIEAVPDSLNGKEKAKPTRIPNPTPQPRPRRSPTPMDEDQEQSGSDSDDDYLPGASSRQGPSGDEGEEEEEEVDDDDEDDEDDEDENEDDEDEVRDDDEDDLDEDEGDNSEPEDANEDVNTRGGGDSDEQEDEVDVGRRKKRERRPKEIKISTKWTWDQRENDRRVKAWRLEDEIDSNPTALHPVRTNWMYEARLGGEPPFNLRCAFSVSDHAWLRFIGRGL